MSLLHSLLTSTDKAKKRLGRGIGSGKGGHTSSRGTKGQHSRTGSLVPLWFEGGQLPLIKRMPMVRGKARFNVIRPSAEVTLTDLDRMQAQEITLDALKLEKIIDHRYPKAKIIANGELTRAVTVKGIRVSEAARKQILKVGGAVEN